MNHEMAKTMTPTKAKKIMREFLDKQGLPYEKLTARTVNFSDLARCQRVFVYIHGWQPSPRWSDVKEYAALNGFCVQVGH